MGIVPSNASDSARYSDRIQQPNTANSPARYSSGYSVKEKWLRVLMNGLKSQLVGISRYLFAALITPGIMLGTMPAWSAERIKFFYPPFGEFTISVTDLEIFAREGRITPDFAFYTQQVTPGQLEVLRELLRRQFLISPVTVSQVAYSPTGDVLLNRLGNVIRTEVNQNGERALRAAFILAAAEPDGLNVVDLLRKFPSRDIRLDLPASLKVARSASDIFQRRDQILAAIKEATPIPPPPEDLSAVVNLQAPGSLKYRREFLRVINPQRSQPVPVDLYIPVGAQLPVPLVVISHGIASDRTTFAYLARHLASHGLAVAVLEHPDTSSEAFRRFLGGLQGSPNASDIVDRPLDITYLLNTLQERSQADPAWRNQINLQAVGVIGQSFGGYTALAVAGAPIDSRQLDRDLRDRCNTQTLDFNLSMLLQCRGTELSVQTYDLRDDRVKAVIAINPVGSVLFGKQGLERIRIPTMIIAGTDDYFAPPVPEQLYPFSWLKTSDRYLLIMDQGTHFSFLGDDEPGVFSVPDGLIGPNPALARPPLQALSVVFFRKYLFNQREYRTYLTSPYVVHLPKPPFVFNLLTSLTEAELATVRTREGTVILRTSPLPDFPPLPPAPPRR